MNKGPVETMCISHGGRGTVAYTVVTYLMHRFIPFDIDVDSNLRLDQRFLLIKKSFRVSVREDLNSRR